MRIKPETPSLRPDFGVVLVKPEASPPETTAYIAECTVTTDSVVATATIRTNGIMRRITADWGDGKVDTLRSRPGVEAVVGGQNELPPGTYKLVHAYAGPEDRKPFDQFVLIRVEDESGVDFCNRKITLTPRYRVTNYRTTLSLTGKCDSWFESESEFEISQIVDGARVNFWKWNAPESSVTGNVVLDLTQYFLLDGSQISRELTLADGSVPVRMDIVEKDQWYDAQLAIYQDLRPTLETALVEGDTGEDAQGAEGCHLGFRYDREVTLVVPMPPLGQTITVMG